EKAPARFASTCSIRCRARHSPSRPSWCARAWKRDHHQPSGHERTERATAPLQRMEVHEQLTSSPHVQLVGPCGSCQLHTRAENASLANQYLDVGKARRAPQKPSTWQPRSGVADETSENAAEDGCQNWTRFPAPA